MTPDRPSSSSRPEHNEPWRMERMVQRVPAHLGETTNEPASAWLVIAGIVLLIVVSCGVLFILLNVPERLKGFSIGAPATATRTPRVVTPGLTAVPATLPPPSPTPGPTAATVKYKVKSGDTLIMIASRYKVTVQAIMAANGLKDETIRIGDELIIPLATPTPPGGASIPQPPAASMSTPTTIVLIASSPPSSAATPGMLSHKVARGDTLISIAATYGSTVDGIRIANQLDGDFLSIGQLLQIPVGAWTPTPLPTSVAMVSLTPTPQFPYAPPNLMWPPDHSVLRGTKDAPMLSWIAAGALRANEVYVVHVDYSVDGVTKPPIVAQVRQGTSYKLDPEKVYPGTSQNGAQFSWYVMIVSQGPQASSEARAETRGPGIAASPPSPTWSFTWY